MTRDELIADLVAERFLGPPVRTDRPRAVRADMAAILAEIDATPIPIRGRLGIACHYAACTFEAEQYVDRWALCPVHIRKHRSEAAS